MIFQMHKDHGRHIAYSPQEAKANEDNGWETVSKETFYDIKEEHDDDLVKEYTEVFGKKPHPRMKLETMKEKIDAHGS